MQVNEGTTLVYDKGIVPSSDSAQGVPAHAGGVGPRNPPVLAQWRLTQRKEAGGSEREPVATELSN